MTRFFTLEKWPERFIALGGLIVGIVTLVKLFLSDKDRKKEIEKLTTIAKTAQDGHNLKQKSWLKQYRPEFVKSKTETDKPGFLVLHLQNRGKRAFVIGVHNLKGALRDRYVNNEKNIVEPNEYVIIYLLSNQRDPNQLTFGFRDMLHNIYNQDIRFEVAKGSTKLEFELD